MEGAGNGAGPQQTAMDIWALLAELGPFIGSYICLLTARSLKACVFAIHVTIGHASTPTIYGLAHKLITCGTLLQKTATIGADQRPSDSKPQNPGFLGRNVSEKLIDNQNFSGMMDGPFGD